MPVGGILLLDTLIETLYLLSENKIKVFNNSKEINEEQLLKKVKKFDKRIETKLL